MATATEARTEAARESPVAAPGTDPGHVAFWLLRTGFTIAPILFGIDKFFNWMVAPPLRSSARGEPRSGSRS